VVSALVLAGCTSGAGSPGPSGEVSTSAATSSGLATHPTADIPTEQWQDARGRAVADVVRQRLEAVPRADVAAWLAPVAGAPLRAAQAAVLERMTHMGVQRLRLLAVRETTPPVAAPPGTRVEWDVRASLGYELHGFDSRPRSFDLDLTFRADPAEPGRAQLTGSTPSDRPQPWDLEGLVVRRSPTALVLAVGSPARVAEVVRRAHTAAARVTAVWGAAPPSVWVAPATDADAARLLGRTPNDLAGVAAATDGPLTPGEHAGADRIVLVPGAWNSLQPDGRDVVMTHELTHVAVRASTTRAVPLWLSEGFAELVAYEPIDLPEATVVASALDRVRASGMPTGLPADADFDPDTRALPATYGLSLLVLRTLADAHGIRAVVRLYRAAAGGLDVPTARLGDQDAAVDEALDRTLDTSRAALVHDWQARIRSLLR
jgi:hypothetical protein